LAVFFLNVSCVLNATASTSTSFACDFPLTSGGSPQLPAGTGKPIIHVAQVGYADVSSLANITLSFQVYSFSPQSSAPTGLISATITGSGFPVSIDSGQIVISLCGNLVQSFISVESDKITFLIPA